MCALYYLGIMDGRNNCPDRSDEHQEHHVGWTCPEGYQLCDNGQCIGNYNWCDGLVDCKDGSDEGPHCEQWECVADYWQCADNRQCIPVQCVCDGDKDIAPCYTDANGACKDKSDEHNILCGYCSEEGQWPCHDGDGCAAVRGICDGKPVCNDESDEDTALCKDWECGTEKYYKCQRYYCIPWRMVCNGKWECPGGTDEYMCNRNSCPRQYKCYSSAICISLQNICDDVHDCPYKDDEYFCDIRLPNCPDTCMCLLFMISCHSSQSFRF